MKHHFKNLAISYLHACCMLFGAVGMVSVVVLLWDGEFDVWDGLGLMAGYTLIAALCWLLPAYLVIGLPYYFGLLIKRPQIRPGTHYVAISIVASIIVCVPLFMEPGSLKAILAWLVTAALASLTAITGMRTLIKRTKQEA